MKEKEAGRGSNVELTEEEAAELIAEVEARLDVLKPAMQEDIHHV